MRRILFVDDEPRVLEGLENLLYPYTDDWDMEFVESGAEALDLLAEEHFDVLVTDMRMPKMDGAELLERVNTRHPDIVRIVLSGHSELEAALRALPIAHQFLSKPCDAETLLGVLERACGLQALISDEVVRSILGNLVTLPSRPKVYSQVMHLLAHEDASLTAVANVVERDIAISMKILKVVNSAFFSMRRQITTVQQAVPLLGASFVNSLVLAAEAFRDLPATKVPGFSIDALHDHSFLTAAIAKNLFSDKEKSQDAFLAATLHEVGQLVLAMALPDHLAQALRLSREREQPLFEVELELTRVSHAEVGAYLLGLWGMRYSIMEAVANHHHPRRSGVERFSLAGALHVADALAEEVHMEAESSTLDQEYLQMVGVADQLPSWRAMAAKMREEQR